MTSSKDQAADSQTLRIYPNPVTGQEISVKGNTANISKAEIYDSRGKLIQTIEKPFRGGSTIRIKKLEQGVYMLRLGETVLKFIVQ